jgi:hypothetical protein|tara:strand:+ start:1126 stop:1269 length:144 start_codon:yes stop_codon:yes gene_type:complete
MVFDDVLEDQSFEVPKPKVMGEMWWLTYCHIQRHAEAAEQRSHTGLL